MNLVVTAEHRFDRTPDGTVWTTVAFAYPFWRRYLVVFDHVRVIARVRDVDAAAPGWTHASGDGVSFAALPYYVGPWQYLRQSRRIRRAVLDAIKPTDAVIMRVGSQIANVIFPELQKYDRPCGLEVVNDPYDVFAPGSVGHPLRPLFRWWFPRLLREKCAAARAATYVTQYALQRRYPAAPDAYSTYYSDVELPDAAFVPVPRSADLFKSPVKLVFVGTFAQLYKAPDVLIDAVGVCARQQLDLRLVLIGDGQYRPKLEEQARSLGLDGRVHFTGKLPAGDAVREQLDQADLFVLPSHQEGLPRAMVEAMARALPCIGSTVGGIPELLPPESMVPPGDVDALARKIREIVTDPLHMARLSARNLERSREYREEALRKRRTEFYQYVRECTEQWLKTPSSQRG
jgi:glycosyltransferase involved in cell wall biosynthesis